MHDAFTLMHTYPSFLNKQSTPESIERQKPIFKSNQKIDHEKFVSAREINKCGVFSTSIHLYAMHDNLIWAARVAVRYHKLEKMLEIENYMASRWLFVTRFEWKLKSCQRANSKFFQEEHFFFKCLWKLR
jgi:hypothetical protein